MPLYADIARGGLLIKPQTALYILERVFALVTYKPLLHNIAVAVLGCPQNSKGSSSSSLPGDAAGVVQPWCVGFASGASPSCRLALAALLRSQEPGVTPAVLRMLVAVVRCGALSAELMADLDVLPVGRRQDLLDARALASTACEQGYLSLMQEERGQGVPIPSDSTTPVVPSGQMVYVYYNTWAADQSPPAHPAHPVSGSVSAGSMAAMNGLKRKEESQLSMVSSMTESDAVAPPLAPSTFKQSNNLPHPLADASGQGPQVSVTSDVAPLISFEDDDSPPSSPAAAQSDEHAHEPQPEQTVQQKVTLEGMGTVEAVVDNLIEGMIESAVRELEVEAGDSKLQGSGIAISSEQQGGGSLFRPESCMPQADTVPPEAPAPLACSIYAPAVHEVGGSWLVDALFDLLSTALVPVHSLWHAAYLLQQWLHRPPISDGASTPRVGGDERSPWACTVSQEQRQQLSKTLRSAATTALAEIDGMWGETVFSLICIDWPVAADNIIKPMLRTASEVITAGPHLYPVQAAPPAQQRTHALSMGISAVNALRVVHVVSRLVALLQLAEVLREGKPSHAPPVPAAPAQDSQRADIIEGMQVEMAAVSGWDMVKAVCWSPRVVMGMC